MISPLSPLAGLGPRLALVAVLLALLWLAVWWVFGT